MREIKFRGKRYGDGAWVYGSLYQGTKEGEKYSVIISDAGYHLAPQDDRNLAIAFAENEVNVVIPDTVGQFVGLCDKYGKEIYEGDIVRYDMGGECEVSYCVSGGYAGFDLSPAFHNEEHHLTDVEVIGNIHDNPELLNE